jgi:hypothetical protein
MHKPLSCAAIGLILLGGLALAQTPANKQAGNNQAGNAQANAQAKSQTAPAAGQLTPQTLGAMLSSAATFHELVQNLNLGKALGPDEHVLGADGQMHHSMDRTAQTIGAGAGAGAAIGAMTHGQNGVLIGALVGAGSGLLIDQILKQREQAKERAANGPAPDAGTSQPDRSRGFKARDGELERHAD